jgi:hypothetical protein
MPNVLDHVMPESKEVAGLALRFGMIAGEVNARSGQMHVPCTSSFLFR